MNTRKLTLLVPLIGILGVMPSPGQEFNSGSDGSYGPLNITSNTTLSMPSNGVFHCTTIDIAAGTTLRFLRNALNTPVYLLATSNVTVRGIVDVSGFDANPSIPTGGAGGPGGFDGGKPGFGASVPPGAGYGPGGGRGGATVSGSTANSHGGGAYGTVGPSNSTTNKGATYGSPLLIPMAGGSGGGGGTGSPGIGGGGGGGAILIASSTRVDVPAGGAVRALGLGGQSHYHCGSGGAIRLVAPVVAGTGSLAVNGQSGYCGDGRIRIDSIDRAALQLSLNPLAVSSVGSTMFVFPTPLPRLDVVEAAGTMIAVGTAAPVYIQLPFGSTTDRTVTVQAQDFGAVVPIRVALTPDSGEPVYYDDTIDNAAENPAQKVINVVMPVNVQVHVGVWTR